MSSRVSVGRGGSSGVTRRARSARTAGTLARPRQPVDEMSLPAPTPLAAAKEPGQKKGIGCPKGVKRSYRSEIRPHLWPDKYKLWNGSLKTEGEAMHAHDATLHSLGQKTMYFDYDPRYFLQVTGLSDDAGKRQENVRSIARDLRRIGTLNNIDRQSVLNAVENFKSIVKNRVKLVLEAVRRSRPSLPSEAPSVGHANIPGPQKLVTEPHQGTMSNSMGTLHKSPTGGVASTPSQADKSCDELYLELSGNRRSEETFLPAIKGSSDPNAKRFSSPVAEYADNHMQNDEPRRIPQHPVRVLGSFQSLEVSEDVGVGAQQPHATQIKDPSQILSCLGLDILNCGRVFIKFQDLLSCKPSPGDIFDIFVSKDGPQIYICSAHMKPSGGPVADGSLINELANFQSILLRLSADLSDEDCASPADLILSAMSQINSSRFYFALVFTQLTDVYDIKSRIPVKPSDIPPHPWVHGEIPKFVDTLRALASSNFDYVKHLESESGITRHNAPELAVDIFMQSMEDVFMHLYGSGA